MATYYVRKTGLDSNDGLSAGAAFLTIDKAANTVTGTSGDTVYVGAGVYRELVTMDTSGNGSGNLIEYIADVDGENTGDAGLVIVSAYDDEVSAATRNYAWNLFGKEFLTIRGFVFVGGTAAAIYDSLTAGNRAYEEVTVEDCVVVAGHDETDLCVHLDLNQGATPTTAGLTFRRSMFFGGAVRIESSENATAEVDTKSAFESCVFLGTGTTSFITGAGIYWDVSASSTYAVGGVSVTNCTFVSKAYGVRADNITTAITSATIDVRNSYFAYCLNGLSVAASADLQITSDFNTFVACQTPLNNVTGGGNDREVSTDPGLLGGIGDYTLYRFLGWSPWKPWEPIRVDDGVDAYTHAVIGAADTTVAPAFDLYNETRPMGARAGSRTDIYYFDASDAGPTDPDVSWTNDANAFDGDSSTTATTTTSGTETTDELSGEGTNAPATGGTIASVEARVYTGTVGTQNWRIYTDTGAESLLNTSTTADDTWSSWSTLTVPTGGWTWAKIQALELILWASAQPGEVGAVQVRVTSTPTGQDDQGAVEARTYPVQDTASVMTGVNSMKLAGAGFQEWDVPVKAQSTTITVDAQFDSNYTGTLPQLEVRNIDGTADQTDTVTTAANTTDTLSITFTPDTAGWVQVRVVSNDTSATGEAFFDDLTVT